MYVPNSLNFVKKVSTKFKNEVILEVLNYQKWDFYIWFSVCT
jgi:hypothetical protein